MIGDTHLDDVIVKWGKNRGMQNIRRHSLNTYQMPSRGFYRVFFLQDNSHRKWEIDFQRGYVTYSSPESNLENKPQLQPESDLTT